MIKLQQSNVPILSIAVKDIDTSAVRAINIAQFEIVEISEAEYRGTQALLDDLIRTGRISAADHVPAPGVPSVEAVQLDARLDVAESQVVDLGDRVDTLEQQGGGGGLAQEVVLKVPVSAADIQQLGGPMPFLLFTVPTGHFAVLKYLGGVFLPGVTPYTNIEYPGNYLKIHNTQMLDLTGDMQNNIGGVGRMVFVTNQLRLMPGVSIYATCSDSSPADGDGTLLLTVVYDKIPISSFE